MALTEKPKYQRVSLGMVPAADAGMAPFRKVPWPTGRCAGYQLMGIAPTFAILCAAIPFFNWFPKLNHGWQGFVFIVVAATIAFGIGFRTTRFMSLRYMASMMGKDLAKLGEMASGDRYVGVAYCDDVWAYRQDTSWDRGILRIEKDRVYFHGYGPGFELPVSAIQNVRIGATQGIVTSNLPRVFVDWTAPDESHNTLSFEIRDGATRAETIAKSEELADQLTDLAQVQHGATEDSPSWPIQSSKLIFAPQSPEERINASDRLSGFLAALIVGAVGVAVFVAIGTLFHWHGASGLGGLFGPICLGVYQHRVTSRTRSRRSKPSPAEPV